MISLLGLGLLFGALPMTLPAACVGMALLFTGMPPGTLMPGAAALLAGF